MKKLIITIIVTFLLLVTSSFTLGMGEIQSLNDQLDSMEISTPKLKIENISGGLGIAVVIKNGGEVDISNIALDAEITKGFLNRVSKKHYEIPLLCEGESRKIRISLFGAGLGRIAEFLEVKINIDAPNIDALERMITAKIFGPLVMLAGVCFNDEASFEGYTLFAPEFSTKTYLINNDGDVVHTWKCKHRQVLGICLLENGSLLRTCHGGINALVWGGGFCGRVEMYDWDGKLIWKYSYVNDNYCMHNDIEVLPNGNFLFIVWEKKSGEEIIAAGCNPDLLLNEGMVIDHIIEVEPTFPSGGNIVWEWHAWDHLIQDYDPSKANYGVVADHPELIDINYRESSDFYSANIWKFIDFSHMNSVDYIEEFDQILLSSPMHGEIWIIDHSTTVEEAAGHTGGKYGKGGDLLYRWGNPRVYGAGDENDQKLFHQHDARWVESGYPGEGHITIFNNGNGRPDGNYSSIEEIEVPVDNNGSYYLEPGLSYGPEEPVWRYVAENPTDFFSRRISGAHRLPNGNTIICSGLDGCFFEVTPEKEIVWQYNTMLPMIDLNNVFEVQRFSPDYPGLANLEIK